MRIRYFSDVHLEFVQSHKIERFIKQIPLPKENEVCVLAGDIGNPYTTNYDIFMKWISVNFVKTFIIPGNHEYYNRTKTIEETNEFMEEYFKSFDNISLLNNKYEIYQDYCFIGSILWSKITNPAYKINDMNQIPNFDYEKYNAMNNKCIEFLNIVIKDNTNCIIITHHMPSETLIDPKYKDRDMLPYNQWFYCQMDDFIEINKSKIKLWFYGHTHTPCNKIIHDVEFCCNPIGYPGENYRNNFGKCIVI